MKPVLPVLSAPLVPLALRVLPVRREPQAQPEQKALPVPSAPPVLLALRVLPVRREPQAQPEQKAPPVPPVPPALQVLPVLSRQPRLLPMQRVKQM